MSSTIVTVIDKEIDLNSLFNCSISYNFDILKQVLEALLKNQQDFEKKMASRDDKIENLEREVIDLKKLKDTVSDHDIKLNDQDTKFENINTQIIIINEKVDSTLELKKDFEELKKKVEEHEENLKEHKIQIDDLHNRFKFLDKKIDDLDQLLKDLTTKFENLEERVNDINAKVDQIMSKINELFKQVEELKIKIMDFNVYDMFKKGGDGGEGSNTDEFIILLQNLEKKVYKKFEFNDERLKKCEDDILIDKRHIETLQQAQEMTNGKIENIHVMIEELRKALLSIQQQLQDYIDEKIKETSAGEDVGMDSNDLLLLKDLEARVIELEKLKKLYKEMNNTVVNNSVVIDGNRKDILKIYELLKNKADINDFNLLKDLVAKLSIQIGLIFDSIETLKLNQGRVVDNSEPIIINKGGSNIDASKYLEKNVFMEFRKNCDLEIENIYKRLDEMKGWIIEINLNLLKCATKDELRSLEERLMNILEELKIACNKKFADKNETAKNLRYLEIQIKQLLDLKKVDKAENWLLAKKPFGGNSCASCETYIGDLQDNNTYIPWNKYPVRDPNERLYRIGSGFSKMLQMLNVANPTTTKKEEIVRGQTSHYFRPNPLKRDLASPDNKEETSNERGSTSKSGGLPKVRVKGKHMVDNNLSADDISLMEEQDDFIEDPHQPKIVKIYKKSKH